MKTKYIIPIVLISLMMAGSANAAVDFPSDEAGISAYVHAKTSIPNLDAVNPLLQQ